MPASGARKSVVKCRTKEGTKERTNERKHVLRNGDREAEIRFPTQTSLERDSKVGELVFTHRALGNGATILTRTKEDTIHRQVVFFFLCPRQKVLLLPNARLICFSAIAAAFGIYLSRYLKTGTFYPLIFTKRRHTGE